MNWNPLTSTAQLAEIDQESLHQPVLILKHSTRCSISSAALSRIERKWSGDDALRLKPYYLDLLTYRPVSNAVEAHYGLAHESPQVLVIRQGRCVYSASHMEINHSDLMAAAQ